MKCNYSSYYCVPRYQVLQKSKYCLNDVIFKKVLRALGNFLVGTFVPPGSGMATPALRYQLFHLDTRLENERLYYKRLDSNIQSKSSNNTYLNIIKIFNKLFKKLNIIKSRNFIITLT